MIFLACGFIGEGFTAKVSLGQPMLGGFSSSQSDG
jgi:hypothetical protein